MKVERDPTLAVSESLGVQPTHEDFVRARREFKSEPAALEFLDDVEKIHNGLVHEEPLAINWDDFAANIESRLDGAAANEDDSIFLAPTFDDEIPEADNRDQDIKSNIAPAVIPFAKPRVAQTAATKAAWRDYSAWLSVAAVIALGVAVTRNTSFGPRAPQLANEEIGQVAETPDTPVAGSPPATSARGSGSDRLAEPSQEPIGSRTGERASARGRENTPSESPSTTYQTREWSNPQLDQQQMPGPSNAAVPAAVPQTPALEANRAQTVGGVFEQEAAAGRDGEGAGLRAAAPASSSARFAATTTRAQPAAGGAQRQADTATIAAPLLTRDAIETIMNRCFGTTSVALPSLSLVVQNNVVRSVGLAGASQEQETCLRTALQNARVALTDGPHRLTQRAQERSRRPSMRRAQDPYEAAEAL